MQPCSICLADFTALLVDIIGNSSSHLTEMFKSASILSGLLVLKMLGKYWDVALSMEYEKSGLPNQELALSSCNNWS